MKVQDYQMESKEVPDCWVQTKTKTEPVKIALRECRYCRLRKGVNWI